MEIRDKIMAILKGEGCKGCVDGSVYNCNKCKTDAILTIEHHTKKTQWSCPCGLIRGCPACRNGIKTRPATIADWGGAE